MGFHLYEILFIDCDGDMIDHHIKHILKGKLLHHAQNLYREDYFSFQQDSVPSHKATRTQNGFEGSSIEHFLVALLSDS
jgi:hypothetical protein